MRRWLYLFPSAALVLVGFFGGRPLAPAWAADPQPYKVALDATGQASLDSLISASSQLVALRQSSPVSPFALIERARADVPRLQTVLDSAGYYQNQVSVTIAGLALTDPGLSAALNRSADSVPVHVAITKGPLYHLGTVTLKGDVPKAGREAFELHTGDPAVAAAVLDAGARMLAALQEDGYALAAVPPPEAVADDQKHLIDITYNVNPGHRATIGQIRFKGLHDVDEAFVRKALTIKPGDRYRPSRIEEARQALVALGVFSAVTVEAGDRLSPDDRLPLTFEVTERPPHTVTLSGNYSTDLGISLSAGWSHHDLLGSAEQLNLTAAGTGLGTGSTGLGYNLSAQFIKPVFLETGQTLEADVSAVKQKLAAYNQTAEKLALTVRRKFHVWWTGSVGLSWLYDRVGQEGTSRLYQLAGVPFTVGYDSTGLTDILSEPVHGGRVSLAITPTQSFGASKLTFAVLQASASRYFDLGGEGRSILALRVLAGTILGGSNGDVPPDQRLYAGGSSTVRGYAYQSIGPQFPDAKPMGAKSVDAATIEFRQRFGEDWGAAAFVDAGQASATGLPPSGAIRVGVGAGPRYYTSIGVVRLDVAVPVNHVRGGDAFELYIGLGQAF